MWGRFHRASEDTSWEPFLLNTLKNALNLLARDRVNKRRFEAFICEEIQDFCIGIFALFSRWYGEENLIELMLSTSITTAHALSLPPFYKAYVALQWMRTYQSWRYYYKLEDTKCCVLMYILNLSFNCTKICQKVQQFLNKNCWVLWGSHSLLQNMIYSFCPELFFHVLQQAKRLPGNELDCTISSAMKCIMIQDDHGPVTWVSKLSAC